MAFTRKPKPTAWVDGKDGQPGGYNEMRPGGICHYDGPESRIPLGLAWTNVPGWSPDMAAISWEVEDPSQPMGVVMKSTAALNKLDIIVGVILNEASLARHDSLIQGANAEQRRKPTYKEYGIIAIRNMRQKLAGKRKVAEL